MARRSSRRTILGAMGIGATTAALPVEASPLPPILLTVFETSDRDRQVRLLQRDLPPLAAQALWAGAARHLVLRWDAHMPWKDEDDEDDEDDDDDDDEETPEKKREDDGGDEVEDTAEDFSLPRLRGEPLQAKRRGAKRDDDAKGPPRRSREPKRRRDGEEEIVTLGAWPLPGKVPLARSLDALAPDAPPLVPARGTHERPVEAPETPLWLSVTFALRRLKTELALGTLLVPHPLTARLATTEGAGLRVRWSTRVRGRSHRLAEAPLGEHEAFARLPYRD